MREVICHYHIFKNAGTSFDAILQHSFGDRHLAFDGPFPFFTIDQEQLDRIILRKPAATAFSSHQIQLPAPVSHQYRVLSVLFLRDPILRIASIWRFKRQRDDGTATAAAAARLDLADWIAASLEDPQEIMQVSNGQTRALGAAFRARPAVRRLADRVEYDLDLARANLLGASFVGRTEHFGTDAGRLAAMAGARGLRLDLPQDLHLNATDRDTTQPAMRVARLLERLPPALADRLLAANAQDRVLYDLAAQPAAATEVAA